MVDWSRGRAVRLGLWLALSALPTAALAQDEGGFGLDLTEEETPPPQPEQEEAPPPAEPPPPAAAERPEGSAADRAAAGFLGERDITQDDRVKAVQRKVYLKTHRFEVTPMITASVNDPYFLKWGGVLRVAYYLADTLAITARGSLLQTLKTDDVRIAQRTFQAQVLESRPQWTAMADVEWSPIYGKVAFMNSILHFEAFVLGGAGVVYAVTSGIPGRDPSFGVDVGGGIRFVAKDWLAVTAGLVNTSYVDSGPTGTAKAATQNMLAVNAGISIFFPFTSTGREAE